MRVVEVEDEHAEARFVAAEIARARRGGHEPRRDRGRLPDERAEPRARGRARPAGRRLPGDRRAAVLRARRDQGRDRVPPGARQPVRRASRSSRIANRPRRGVGDTSLARLQTFADGDRRLALGGARPRRGGRPRDRVAARGAVAAQPAPVADGRSRRTCRVAELVERVLERSGYLEALEAERTIEARGRIENLEELVGVAREYEVTRTAAARSRRSRSSCRRSRSLRTRTTLRDDERRPGDADDAAQREGPRVPRRVHARDGGRDLPALALDRGERHRGGAAALLRRHDAREGAADDDARGAPLALRPHRREPAVAVPRRAARGGRRARAAAAGVVVELRRAAVEPGRAAELDELPSLSTGDAVRHHSLGTGIVTRIEPDGVVTVRFEDGAERRLMLEYAPLEKVAG